LAILVEKLDSAADLAVCISGLVDDPRGTGI